MATDKPNEVNPVEAGSAAESEAGPSRRDLLVQGGRVVAGIGEIGRASCRERVSVLV